MFLKDGLMKMERDSRMKKFNSELHYVSLVDEAQRRRREKQSPTLLCICGVRWMDCKNCSVKVN